MAVLEALANSGNPVTPDRVILGRPEAEGLYGQEAPGVARRMFSNQSGGQGTGARHAWWRRDIGWNSGRRQSGGAGTSGGIGGGVGFY